MTYCIGITGHIASGKSTVAAYFKSLGIDIINADDITKELTTKGAASFEDIVQHFGNDVLTIDGELNRKYLREKIFKQEESRLWLENLLHPLIRKEIETKLALIKSPYCMIEIPLLSDKADYPYLNRVLLVESDPDLQIERSIKRDSHSREDVLTILAIQNSKIKHPTLINDIIVNNQTLESLKITLQLLHKHYLDLSRN